MKTSTTTHQSSRSTAKAEFCRILGRQSSDSPETLFYEAVGALSASGQYAAAETLYSKYVAEFENQAAGVSDNRQDAVDYQEHLESYSDGEPRQAAADRAKLAAYGLPVAPRPRPSKPARSEVSQAVALIRPSYTLDAARLTRNIIQGEKVVGTDWPLYISQDAFIASSDKQASVRAEFAAVFGSGRKTYATNAERQAAYRARRKEAAAK